MPDNFTIHTRGQFLPAECIRCKRAEHLVDLGAGDVDDYGRPYLCVLCVRELCTAMDYIPAGDNESALASLRVALEREREEHKQTKNKLASATIQTVNPALLSQPEIKEFLDGINDLLDRLSRRVHGAADRGGDPVPVPADGEKPDAAVGGVGEADRTGDDPQPAKRRPAPKRNRGRVGAGSVEPVGTAGRGDDADGSLERAGAEVDGPDVDASFGWARAHDDARDNRAAVFDGPAADE